MLKWSSPTLFKEDKAKIVLIHDLKQLTEITLLSYRKEKN